MMSEWNIAYDILVSHYLNHKYTHYREQCDCFNDDDNLKMANIF
jgi:hypothetical protein